MQPRTVTLPTFAAFWAFLYYREKLDAKKTNKTETAAAYEQVLQIFSDLMSVSSDVTFTPHDGRWR